MLSLAVSSLSYGGRTIVHTRGAVLPAAARRALATALDGETERRVLSGLRRSARDGRRTTVLVPHRREAVLRRGRLVELGTPAELARAGGWFATSFMGASDARLLLDER